MQQVTRIGNTKIQNGEAVLPETAYCQPEGLESGPGRRELLASSMCHSTASTRGVGAEARPA